MNPRFRALSALFALIALLLFQVEALWASSACSMETDMAAAAQPVDAASHSDAAQPVQADHPHGQHGSGSQAPECPLMPAGTASCVGGVAVLGPSAAPALHFAESRLPLASSDHAKDLLLAVSLLRPPQA